MGLFFRHLVFMVISNFRSSYMKPKSSEIAPISRVLSQLHVIAFKIPTSVGKTVSHRPRRCKDLHLLKPGPKLRRSYFGNKNIRSVVWFLFPRFYCFFWSRLCDKVEDCFPSVTRPVWASGTCTIYTIYPKSCSPPVAPPAPSYLSERVQNNACVLQESHTIGIRTQPSAAFFCSLTKNCPQKNIVRNGSTDPDLTVWRHWVQYVAPFCFPKALFRMQLRSSVYFEQLFPFFYIKECDQVKWLVV